MVIHKHSSRVAEQDSVEKFTSCGAAANEEKYPCSSNRAKVTCKKCQRDYHWNMVVDLESAK